MSTIHGILGRPYVSLEDHLDLGALDAVHEEVCLGLTRVPVDYTGGSHRAMGIMPPSRAGEAHGDSGEVIRAMSRDELVRFRDLAEDPGSMDAVLCTHGETLAALLGHWQAQGRIVLAPPTGKISKNTTQKSGGWLVQKNAQLQAVYLPPPDAS